jgi:hypothetical protein
MFREEADIIKVDHLGRNEDVEWIHLDRNVERSVLLSSVICP